MKKLLEGRRGSYTAVGLFPLWWRTGYDVLGNVFCLGGTIAIMCMIDELLVGKHLFRKALSKLWMELECRVMHDGILDFSYMFPMI